MINTMSTLTKTLYDTDFVEWAAHMAELLRQGRLDDLDLEHIAEEMEDLGNSERSAVSSQLHRMLKHLVKQRIQPERDGKSWIRSITEGRAEVEYKIDQSPSLRRYAAENLQKIYRRAVRDALAETGMEERSAELAIPPQCPWSLGELLDGQVSGLDRP
jgi:Domain of unknown function DUF29